jgi:hypothetical protein
MNTKNLIVMAAVMSALAFASPAWATICSDPVDTS